MEDISYSYDDELPLGYFDSSEEFDDKFYLSEEENKENSIKNTIVTTTNYNYNNSMRLPRDIMKEILYQSDIHTFVELCNSGKVIKGMCTNDMWKYKFNQHNINIVGNPKTYRDWIQLYIDYDYHFKVKKYIDAYPKNDKDAIIYLTHPLSNDKLKNILENIGAKWIFSPVLGNRQHMRALLKPEYGSEIIKEISDTFYNTRFSQYAIPLYIKTSYNYTDEIFIGKICTLTPTSFHELIYQLFKQHYLK